MRRIRARRIPEKWFGAIVAGVLASALGILPAQATVMLKQNVEQLSQRAAFIVEGTVSTVASQWNASRSQIHTDVTFDVTEVYGGESELGPLQIRLLGGTVGEISMIVSGAPRFAPGEHLVLFLYDDSRFQIPVVGMIQGKLAFDSDSQTGEAVVGNPHVGFFSMPELRSLVNQAREGR